ncbi:hypothetical protein BBF96_09455 [Anoxybacter fermentans]|uniref:Transport permease protein n=1 Tax=Anoxybacter fermentans TaxID=1323375 RepID=A0A3Q9HRC6_9FIRM|nr:ABC transporter permease [Anoxybacter fermentans]AZR73595.1 hypothetical protein BBF96_09455 [Anoxybacter fermentans]
MGEFFKVFVFSFKKQVREFKRYPNFFLKSFFYTPFAIILPYWFTIRVFLGQDDLESLNMTFTLLLGAILWNFIYFSVIESYNIINRELNTGTIELIYLSPASRIAWLLGSSFAPSLMFLFSLGAVTTLFYFLFRLSVTINLWTFSIALLMTVISSWSMSLMVFILTIWLKKIFNVLNFSLEVIAIFVGILYPVTYLPIYIRWISYCIPVTYGISLIRESFMSGYSSHILLDIVALSVLTVIYMAFSVTFFTRLERRLKNNGNFLKF